MAMAMFFSNFAFWKIQFVGKTIQVGNVAITVGSHRDSNNLVPVYASKAYIGVIYKVLYKLLNLLSHRKIFLEACSI